ncbi:LOW QUALITY PROTEIN: katanin p80 WD40 repeat-containing subunit B1 [Drosophila obscura]|uniref:LOW QUALITY PROTEIN: katanin p80 WD40 repeat-containing subunit B1 n=1 Tax=Drosophila obscura TaxID=7282 RepID=UPI001BB17B1B|nr:LOW QUALITY PROTEIN: katanin p80 WD40 repeat-containing subunit B1 [Drosophila obscura]
MALSRNLISKIYDIKAHDGKVTSLDLGETGRVLVTGGEDRNVNLWAIGQNECFMSLTGHNRSIDCVRFAYKDNFVYSADDIGIIRRWDLNAQKIYSTLNGHMKSVRTLDFNPSGEYVVSGSNDTTVRLWDVQNENNCIRVCRGHVSHVNSVKFSPDGLWIASAGLEGSILIWDIRKSKQIMEFIAEPPVTAITCIQFHPFEFLLAAGRIDGTVSIYDLEHQQLVSQTTHFYGQAIRCITFSDNGECLFVGSVSGISVIGWEPDRELDHIKGTWSSLGDMKVVNNKLICGCHEIDAVSINTISLDRVIPFYQPPNTLPNFKHNSTSRKSFTRGNQKFRLSLGGSKPAQVKEEQEHDNKGPNFDDLSSPNLSLEVLNEAVLESTETSPMTSLQQVGISAPGEPVHPYSVGIDTTQLRHTKFSRLPDNMIYNIDTNYSSYSSGMDVGVGSSSSRHLQLNGPSSLHAVENYNNIYPPEKEEDDDAEADVQHLEYNLNESNAPILSNYDNYEMAEDFPVNQNLNFLVNSYKAVPPFSSTINASSKSIKKTTTNLHKRGTGISNTKQTSTAIFGSNKLSQVSSVSSMELHKLDDNMILKKSSSSNVVNKNKRPMGATAHSQFYKENSQQKNINVEIITKPPMRSRTTLDMRISHQNKTQEKHTHQPLNNHRIIADDHQDFDFLSRSHEAVLQELSNRQTSLDLLRHSTRSHDVLGALKQARNTGRSIFIDLLGAILEKPSSWNLDFCIFVLPEIFELLQSQHKFHFTRACDTLRIILSNFLPTIQENLDPWAANGLGVDVTREDRQRKCAECQRWLLQIKNLPESIHFGGTLSQLQNIIIF